MFKKFAMAIATISVLSSSFAQAAVLSSVSDGVLVNHGKGFAAASSTELNAGDTVMVKKGLKAVSAKIVYDKSCTITVAPGTVTVVAAVAPCSAKANQDMDSYAADLPADKGVSPAMVSDPGVGGFGLGLPAIIGGAVLVGGGAALIAVLAHNGKTSP